jgi:alpha-tubulin suppressor-like RCC1 family protein
MHIRRVLGTVTLVGVAGCSSGPAEEPEVIGRSTAALLSSQNLELKVLTNSCGTNQVQDFFQVVNKGTKSVALSDLTIKFWANDTSSVSMVASVNTGGCVFNASGCIRQVTGTTAAVTPFAPACGPDPSHQANREIKLSTTDRTLLAPGQSWTNLQSSLRLSNSAKFTPGTGTWYSPCLAGTTYTADPHFSLYYQGNLVVSSALTPPACRSPQGRQKLPGYVTSEMASAPLVGPLSPTQVIRFGVGLPLQKAAELQTFLEQVTDPTSPTYRAYLTPDQFTAQYAPASSAYQSVVTWANANGLTVDNPTSSSRMLVNVRGSAASVGKALYADFVERLRPDGSKFYTLDRDPSLDLDTSVLHVSGLDNFQQATAVDALGWGTGDLGYLARDFRGYYASCTNNDGNGQVVGIFALDGFHADDIALYAAADGLSETPNVTTVSVDGFDGNPRGVHSKEIELDIEMAMGMAPGAEVRVYEADPYASELNSLNAILDAMTTRLPLAYQLSSSTMVDVTDAVSQQLINKAVAQGQSFFLPSGDTGGFVTASARPINGLWGITSVGGTGFIPSKETELAWSESGGGLLTSVPIPDYQLGLDMSTNGGSTTCRNLPDVAFPAWNVEAFVGDGIHQLMTGTSISAPLWAGFTALINQESAHNGNPPVGFLNPVVYAIGGDPALYGCTFNDITISNNGKFSAVSGYDLVTGWGSPKCALITQLGSAHPLTATRVGVTAGYLHACAVLADGSVKCWGNNEHGQLGDGTTMTRTAPVAVAGLEPVSSVSGGLAHTCAVLRTGGVKCWGSNMFGDLGDDTTTDRLTPVLVHGLTDAIAVSAGWTHTCALRSNHTVMCWGNNGFGELGDGSGFPMRTTPVAVSDLDGVLAVVAGMAFTCAVTSTGSAECWGENGVGELGDGTTSNRPTPVNVVGLAGPIAVAACSTYGCALDEMGRYQCWGTSDSGQLGDGVHAKVALTAESPSSLEGNVAIYAGPNHACVIESDRSVGCWGDNTYGQIGDGTTVERTTVTAVNGLDQVVAVGVGLDFTCAVNMSGDVYCWGVNEYGTLGDGTTTSSPLPKKISF